MSSNFDNKLLAWFDHRLPIISMAKHSLVDYPAPRNLSYWWNFGSIAGICLVIQIVTGIFLAMQYTPHIDLAFGSVENIMRNVNFGWLLRYVHAVGASMFFTVVYIHIFRGLYYGSYKSPREVLWWLGIVILLLMMATAFMGYVLPWGQMSFWGATVITNLFSAFPVIGEGIVSLLWGGFSVDNPTLNRFFALHYLMPFLIVGVVGLHLMALHQHGSNNPLGIDAKGKQDKIPFHPYYTVKDGFGFAVFFIVFAWFVFFSPNSLGHPDNYIPANPMVTPAHIVPEWYFLPFYAILRAVTFDTPLWLVSIGIAALSVPLAVVLKRPTEAMIAGVAGISLLIISVLTGAVIDAKLAGVLAMFASIIILFVLPWLDTSPVRSGAFRPAFKWFFWLFVADCIILGYAGSKPADWGYLTHFEAPLPNISISQIAALYYFAHFLVVLPLLSKHEVPLPLPESISKAVLAAEYSKNRSHGHD